MIKTHIPARPRNKKILPTGSASISPSISSAVGSSHTHNNKPVIDQLTQGNIDVLSYLSLYQTGVEMEVLLDEFGQPVLDINGDPVTEQIPIYAIKSTATFFSEKEVSAYGLGDGGSGGGGGDYDMLLSWTNYSTETEQWVISAALAKDMLDRVVALEAGGGSGGSSVVWGAESGGYASLTVDSVSKSVALSGHTHSWSSITGKPSTFTPSAHTHSAGDITSGTFSIARIPTGTTGTTVALGNHLHTGVYEPVFSKNTAFNKDFGTELGTVAQGNDSRIINGQTAFGWGNHASAGYALNSAFNTHNTDDVRHITGAERTKWDGVVTDFGNLEIGGVNLLINSKNYTLSNPIFAESTATDSGMDENFWIITLGSAYLQINIPQKIAVGERFTFSFIHTRKTNTAQDFQVAYGSEIKQFNSNSDVQKFVFTSVKTSDSYLRLSRVLGGSGWTLRIDELQLEKGNKATDWSPAPEDQVSDWNTTDVNSFSFIKNKPTTLSGYGITDAVTLNTAQTITGAKTFSAALVASVSIQAPKIIFLAGGWTVEQYGTEIQFKYNGTTRHRMLSDGTFVASAEITAYG